jgi:predicted RNase H-like nuclease (RuvC/YqgF family)
VPILSESKIKSHLLSIRDRDSSEFDENLYELKISEEENIRVQLERTIRALEKNISRIRKQKDESTRKLYKEWDLLTEYIFNSPRELNDLRKDLQERRYRIKEMNQFFKDGKTFQEFIYYEVHEKGIDYLSERFEGNFGKELGNTHFLPPILPPKIDQLN